MKKIDPNTGKEISRETLLDGVGNDGPVFTQQSGKDECDINLIVESAKRGADLSQRVRGTPMYGDFTNLPDYRSALLMVNKARDMFMGLDAFVRERFGNDPGRLLDFLSHDENREEAIKLGLIELPKVPVPDEHLETLKSIDKGLKSRSRKVSDDE